MKKYRFELGPVDVSELDSDDDFRQEAKRLLPKVMKQVATRLSEGLWEDFQQRFRRGVGGSSPSEKAEFLKAAVERYSNNSRIRRDLKRDIIKTLREMKSADTA